MGAKQSNLNTAVFCGPECQRENKLNDLWRKYQNTISEKKNIPNKIWQAKYNYYMVKYGPSWYNKYKTEDAKNKLENLKKNMESKIKKLINKYKEKIYIQNTQNLLINKQNLSINEKKRIKLILEKSILSIKYLHSTKLREIEQIKKQNIAYTYNRKSYILIFFLILIVLIMSVYLIFKK